MYLKSIAHAVPLLKLSQGEAWNRFSTSEAATELQPSSIRFMERVMKGKSGIDYRHYAVDPDEQLFGSSAQQLSEAFESEAPALGTRALEKALRLSQLDADEIDALFVCTCTGYLCPGLSSYLSERLGLRSNAYLQDIVGQGCGAALPTLHSAANFSRAHEKTRIAVVAVEVCSAAFYVDDDPGVLISAALFGDGASASIWTSDPIDSSGWQIHGFDTVHRPEHRDLLRFKNKDGKLKNVLSPAVPDAAGKAVRFLYDKLDTDSLPQTIIAHPGGREVLRAVTDSLERPIHPASAETLRKFGNMSSPSVLFALEEALQTDEPESVWLTSFGAGMSAHSASLTRVTT